MGLGLSAITALLLLLPGIAFVLGINRLLTPDSPPAPLDQHFSIGLILALVASILLHVVGVGLIGGWAWLAHGPHPEPAHAIVMLSGQVQGPVAEAALKGLGDYPLRIALYFLTLTLVGFYAGKFSNRFVYRRSAAVWSDLLSPVIDQAEVAFIVLTAEVNHGGTVYLYSGFLSEYRVGRDGALERVVLREYAARRPLNMEGAENDVPPMPNEDGSLPGGWLEIPGEAFVLQMKDVKTVNVDYFYVDDTPMPEDEASADESMFV